MEVMGTGLTHSSPNSTSNVDISTENSYDNEGHGRYTGSTTPMMHLGPGLPWTDRPIFSSQAAQGRSPAAGLWNPWIVWLTYALADLNRNASYPPPSTRSVFFALQVETELKNGGTQRDFAQRYHQK